MALVPPENKGPDLSPDELKSLFSKIPPTLLSVSRIEIMTELYKIGAIEYSQLKRDIGLSDGALASHLRMLAKNNYIVYSKDPKEPASGIVITPTGISELTGMLKEFRRLEDALMKDVEVD